MTKARKNYNLIPPAAALLLLAGVLGVMGALRVRTRSSRVFSDAVNGHRKLVETYALKERIPEEADALLAIMEIESGGRAEDVMQSSESLGLPPNTLDTEASVAQGCAYYAMLLRTAAEEGLFRPDAGPGAVRGRSGEKAEKAERAEEAEDAEKGGTVSGWDSGRQAVFQAYNYGVGYLYFAKEHGGHSRENAELFAELQSGGKQEPYSHPAARAANGGWRYSYGNMFYAELVEAELRERMAEHMPGRAALMIMTLTALLYGSMAALLLWRPQAPAAAVLLDLKQAELKRKTNLPWIRKAGFLSGTGAVLLFFGMVMAAAPREFCGGVLAVMTASAVFSAVEGGRVGALIRGLLPAVSLLLLLR